MELRLFKRFCWNWDAKKKFWGFRWRHILYPRSIVDQKWGYLWYSSSRWTWPHDWMGDGICNRWFILVFPTMQKIISFFAILFYIVTLSNSILVYRPSSHCHVVTYWAPWRWTFCVWIKCKKSLLAGEWNTVQQVFR